MKRQRDRDNPAADYDPQLYDPRDLEQVSTPKEPRSHFGSANRNMAVRLWASIFVRATPTGASAPLCTWCERKLTKPRTLESNDPMRDSTATIDHLDNDDQNNTPQNMVAACMECNRTRGSVDYRVAAQQITLNQGRKEWAAYLRRRGTNANAARSRVGAQIGEHIPRGDMRFSPLHGRAIVSIWAPRATAKDADARTRAEQRQNQFAQRVDRLMIAWRGERITRIREKGAKRAKNSREYRQFARNQEEIPFDV
jgi:5-methylcytosine-specific restriction endonuclease McrA